MKSLQDTIITTNESVKEFVRLISPITEMFRTLRTHIGSENALEAVTEAGEALKNAGGSIVEDLNELHILAMHAALIRYVSERTSREAIGVFLETKDQVFKKAV